MEFAILGPLEVWRDGGEVELGAAKPRALLAVLLLHAGETMPTERLVDALWGERPPAQAVKALQVYVSQLRKALGEGVVETRRLGYLVHVEDGALDLQRFETLLAEGRRLLAAGSAPEAGEVLRRALGLWRGEPLVDFRYEAFAAEAIGRLEELRLIAHEARLEADLAVGRSVESVPELEALVRRYPLRESLRGLLMRALYRAGRQADALAVMQDTRATLRDELGLDPGQPLQQLEKAILLQDPALDLAPPSTAVASEPAAAGERATEPREPTAAPRAQRKLVTVVFVDVTDSTLLNESFDPEVVRALLARYAERTKAAAERHGGVVGPVAGDAIMAVFGIPAVHEDDALRALRAAVEMQGAFAELGIEGRVGVESGECVVGTGERLATGRAVTTAERLEHAARPGEILLGDGTMRLVSEAATVESVEPLALEGRLEPVAVWRLLSVAADAPAGRFDSPFVDRVEVLQTLRDTWERVGAKQQCELVTVVADAGVGKSRLVAELLRQVEATEGHGRCLSYGAGITYWPVRDMLTQLQLRPDAVDPSVEAPLRALLEDAATVTTHELAWAFRKFVESVARTEPLALVFDDIHWGEEALLDLIEHVALVSTAAPILLLCMARQGLLERRPGWRGVLRLDPLTREQTKELVDARMGNGGADPAVSQRIVAAAEGNPLFVEEMAAVLQESGAAAPSVPPTIQALLEARLDALPDDERTVLEAASVEGEVFHAAAVQTLVPDESRPAVHLTALVRKEFIRPDRASLEGEDGFRFHHLLLRDATYDAIPKATRARLHERYADWLEARAEALDAFVGYHLEQAYRYDVELRSTGANTDMLAWRASEHLERAAAAALNRSDFSAAVNLLRRAAAPPPILELRRARLMAELVTTLMEAGKLAEAESVVDEAQRVAATADDECVQARLLVEQHWLKVHRAARGTTQAIPVVVEQVIPIFEQARDDRGLSRTWQLNASANWWHGHISAATEAWERAAAHARAAGSEHEWALMLTWIASSTWTGATPVEVGIRRIEEIREAVRGHPGCEAEVLRPLGGLHGFAGRFELARSLFAIRAAALDELGRGLNYAARQTEPFVEMLAGDFATAERQLREGYDALEAMGENAVRSTTSALLARAVLAQGRHDEAERFTKVAEELGEPDDLLTQIVWRGVRARVAAGRGNVDEGERLAREAVAAAGETDFVNFRADALLDLATVLDTAGRTGETRSLIEEAVRLYEAKGNTVSAQTARARINAAV